MYDRKKMKLLDETVKKRRGYLLKYNLIPLREKKLKRINDNAKQERAMLIKYKNELAAIELGLQEEITRVSFLESLKCPTKKPNVKLPKSWRNK